jgi:hypothetical protein
MTKEAPSLEEALATVKSFSEQLPALVTPLIFWEAVEQVVKALEYRLEREKAEPGINMPIIETPHADHLR